MWPLLALISIVMLVDLAAVLWGVDSREGGHDPAWASPDRVEPSLVPVRVRENDENRR